MLNYSTWLSRHFEERGWNVSQIKLTENLLLMKCLGGLIYVISLVNVVFIYRSKHTYSFVLKNKLWKNNKKVNIETETKHLQLKYLEIVKLWKGSICRWASSNGLYLEIFFIKQMIVDVKIMFLDYTNVFYMN